MSGVMGARRADSRLREKLSLSSVDFTYQRINKKYTYRCCIARAIYCNQFGNFVLNGFGISEHLDPHTYTSERFTCVKDNFTYYRSAKFGLHYTEALTVCSTLNTLFSKILIFND